MSAIKLNSLSPFDPLTLRNGAVIPNRIAKAAMEENMADSNQGPSDELLLLYQAWAQGGAGLILTGNVMVDCRAMTGPAGVVLEDDAQLDKFRRWASIGKAGGAQFWMQINHPGRQMRAALGQQTWAPSAVALEMGNVSKLFAVPQAMDEDQIADVIRRFARTARLAECAGFSGVQIHAAHGYLISQFLSPLTNRRSDQWGGSLMNRARLLLETIKAVRAEVAPNFCVSVKLNSADFQRGGFSSEDAIQIVRWLNELPVELVELSGGSFEAPAIHGEARDGQTLEREAYFLRFASDIAQVSQVPIMVTGGIRRLPVVQSVLDAGVSMAGIGAALALDPGLPGEWRDGFTKEVMLRAVHWKSKPLAAAASMAIVKFQLRRLSRGLQPKPSVAPLKAFLVDQFLTHKRTQAYLRLMSGHRSKTTRAS